jgi:ribose 5-phosphate isomerase B
VTLFAGSDHAGFELKEKILKTLAPLLAQKLSAGRHPEKWVDCGPGDESRVDYPDFADRVCKEVMKSSGRGILVCGSGQGMAMRANRFLGIRAALVWNSESARLARLHNDANVLCLGGRLLEHSLCFELVEIFLSTPFEGGRHLARVQKLGAGV